MVLMERALNWAGHGIDSDIRKPGECKISIIGIGGCGNNAVNRIMGLGVDYIECVAVNTDIQQLNIVNADQKILIGEEVTLGLGAGKRPSTGKRAIMEDTRDIEELLIDRDIVFISAGLGGGTGTGAAPIIAKLAREHDSIVVGVVTMPFHHEKARYSKAIRGLNEIRRHAHTVIVIDNNKLVEIGGDMSIESAFGVADTILGEMVKSIIETITMPSLINIDFADFRTLMNQGDVAIMGRGSSSGTYRATEATRNALKHILLDVDYDGANGALIHVTGGEDATLGEVVKAAEEVSSYVDDESMVIWGSRVDPSLGDEMEVTVLLTGIRSPHIVGGFEMKDIELYNMEPYAGPDNDIDLDMDLYDMEWDV